MNEFVDSMIMTLGGSLMIVGFGFIVRVLLQTTEKEEGEADE